MDQGLPPPPPARAGHAVDQFFGIEIHDPYRWMEDWKSPEATSWLQAQAEYAESFLSSLSDRSELLRRIAELGDASPSLHSLRMAGGHCFLLRRDPGEKTSKLVVRMGCGGEERLLLDPNALPSKTHFSIDWYVPSPDGSRVAYGLSEGGSEDSVLHVLEVPSARVLDEAIPRTQWGAVSWIDGERFLYFRFPELKAGGPPAARYLNGQVFLHAVGQEHHGDPVVLGRSLNSRVAIEPEDFPIIEQNKSSAWALAVIVHGVQNELTLFAAPKAALTGAAKDIPWTPVATPQDGITGFSLSGSRLFLQSHNGAPRYKVLCLDLPEMRLSAARLIVPPSDYVIQAIRVCGEHLITLDLHAGLGRLRRVPLSGGAMESIRLPFEGSILEWAGEPGGDALLVQMTGWTHSPLILRYTGNARRLEDTGWREPSPVDFSGIASAEVHAPSIDGTLVPLSIIHRKDIKLDGSNPVLLTGYGSYGISHEPAFSAAMMAWYERGGIYAVAHVRGGGEYGKEWHEAGRKARKQNTIDDFIACAEYLVRHGYTRPELLAGSGTSAGGITAGGAMVQRPELWGAVVLRVADTNTLRSEFMESGPANVPEFGTASTEEGFRNLLAMDAYLHVRDGIPYPAVLITTGTNDPRVSPWQGMKMAARLQAASNSGKPVLLRVDFASGHGIGSTKQQRDAEFADQLAFLLRVLRPAPAARGS